MMVEHSQRAKARHEFHVSPEDFLHFERSIVKDQCVARGALLQSEFATIFENRLRIIFENNVLIGSKRCTDCILEPGRLGEIELGVDRSYRVVMSIQYLRNTKRQYQLMRN